MFLTKLPNYGLLVLVATDVLKYIYIFKNWEFRVALLEEETHSLVN